MRKTVSVVGKRNSGKKTGAVKSRVRRSPSQLLEALKAKRSSLEDRYNKLIGSLDNKIQKLESKYQKRLMVEQLIKEKSVEELEAELAALKTQAQAIKQAKKQKAGAA